MKCSKCNNDIFEGQEVCLKCGHILGYESELSKKCIHCNREIPIAYKKCPYCKKNQKKKRYLLKFLVIVLIIFIDWNLLTMLYAPDTFIMKKDYKEKCQEIKYETLIRKNDKYKETLVTFDGIVTKVEKSGKIFNILTITIKNHDDEYEVVFNNKKDIGFINGDKVTIYGKFNGLNGNIPVINAKYIIIKNTD